MFTWTEQVLNVRINNVGQLAKLSAVDVGDPEGSYQDPSKDPGGARGAAPGKAEGDWPQAENPAVPTCTCGEFHSSPCPL